MESGVDAPGRVKAVIKQIGAEVTNVFESGQVDFDLEGLSGTARERQRLAMRGEEFDGGPIVETSFDIAFDTDEAEAAAFVQAHRGLPIGELLVDWDPYGGRTSASSRSSILIVASRTGTPGVPDTLRRRSPRRGLAARAARPTWRTRWLAQASPCLRLGERVNHRNGFLQIPSTNLPVSPEPSTRKASTRTARGTGAAPTSSLSTSTCSRRSRWPGGC